VGVVLCLILSGCAQKVWTKPDATQQDFATDSYACERDARQSGYFGGGIAGAINMEQFADRCMVAHGWRLENGATSPAQKQNATNLKAVSDQRISCVTMVRQEPKFTPIKSHFSNLKTGEFTMSDLVDQRIPTGAESALIVQYSDETLPCINKFLSEVSVLSPELSTIFHKERADVNSLYVQLASRHLTWGQAAQKQQEIIEDVKDKLRSTPL
jgi:hypothetical protein